MLYFFIFKLKMKTISIIIYTMLNFIVCMSSDFDTPMSGFYTDGLDRILDKIEIVVPEKISKDGSFVSYYLPHYYNLESENRPRRTSGQERGSSKDAIHFFIPIDGEKHHLELWPNMNFIAPGLIVERRDARDVENINKAKISQISRRQCHYSGQIVGKPNATAALSTCYGLAGYIRVPTGDEYMIEPVKDSKPTHDREHPHIIYKRSGMRDKHGGTNCLTRVLLRVLERANIIPIPKVGDSSDIKSYRPIAIFFTTRKVFESLVADKTQASSYNQALNQKTHDIQQQMKVILDHSIESDQRLLEFTDQVFVARLAVNVPSSPHQSRDQYCQTSDNYQHPCERCSIFKEEVQNMLTTIKTLEEEIKVLKTEKLSLIEKTNCTSTQHTNSIPLSNNKYEILSHLQDKPDDFTIVTKKKKKQKPNKKKKNNHFLKTHKTKIENGCEKIKKLPFRTVSIVGDSHARHLAGMMRAMVDGDTDVSATCKPGAGLLNTTPDPAPPPGNCFVLVSGNNDVAAGRQNIIFDNLEEVIKNCRMTSKVLITPLFPRYDLPPDSPIRKNIRLANAYISELCVRREGVEMVDISRIGPQFFTAHGQHLRASGKRLLAGLMAEHLASMTSKPHCPRPTAPSNTGGAPDPSRRGTPGLPPCDPRRASPGTSAAMVTSSAGASALAVVGRESTDGRLLQRVTYAEAVGGSHGGEASPDGTCF
ncbi:hypothetical protein J6590_015596 [Homalodisca vitripennis]|nr:hypothetical protein J6590_015596 [Homalodisca vitripennis]